MDFAYNFSKSVLRVYLAAFIKRIHVFGRENLHPGPKIIIANHSTLSDSFVLPFLSKEKLHFLIQSDAFDVPILRWLLTKAGQIPVAKGRGEEARDAALEKLSAGKSVVLFPEGRLNHGKELHQGRSGAAVLALLSGAPLLPVGFYVARENTRMLTKQMHDRISKARMQIRGACYVRFGKPWSVPRSKDTEILPERVRDVTDKIMSHIASLAGQTKAEAQGL
jgi:1-acyl-sn-glycerol-3-phosphate acyltransferase